MPIAVVLSGVSTAAILYLFHPAYRATAVVQISSRAPFIAYKSDEPVDTSKEFIETQIELFRSPLVLENVLEEPEIAQLPEILQRRKPLEWLATALMVKQIGHSELYNVFLDNADPKIAAKLVNAVIDGYFDVRRRDEIMRTERVIELLQQEKQARATDVQRLREKMRSLNHETIGKDPLKDLPTGSGSERSHPLHTLQEQMATAEVECKFLEVEIQAVNEAILRDEIEVPEKDVQLGVDSSGEISELRALIATKKATLHRVESASAFGKEDASYRRLEREIQSYEKSFERAISTARPSVTNQLKAIAALDRKDGLKRLQSKLDSRRAMGKIYRERYEAEMDQARLSGNKSLELEFTRDELAREEKVFEIIAERSMVLATEMRAPGRITLLRRAEPPRYPIEKMPLRNLALAIFASFFLPFGIASLWEFNLRRINDPQQLLGQSALPMVREVTRLPFAVSLGMKSSRRSTMFEECIENLRVSLLLSDNNSESHPSGTVLAVVSAVQGEGKTSIASQLAVSIARCTGQSTLLIDGDMRSPDIHAIFNVPNERGFAEVLDGVCTFDEAVVTGWSQHVHLLLAGKLRKSPYSLFRDDRLESLIQDLRSRYAHIIIDTPPILSAAESLLLTKVADQTILCTMRNSSREDQVRLACSRLAAAGTEIAGVVLNGVSTRKYTRTYGSYHYISDVE